MDTELFTERNERLGSRSGRQEQVALVLAELEAPRGADAEGDLEALRLLIVDAIMEHDDYTLRHGVEGLHRLLVLWAAAGTRDPEISEAHGELRGLHNVASMALERMVPLAILAEISPDTLPHDVLSYIVDHPGCSNEDIGQELGTGKTQVSRAGRRLGDAGLARKRRTGSHNSWQATPRGVAALHVASTGWPRPAGRQRSRT